MFAVFDQSGDDGSSARSLKGASARANLRGQVVAKMVRGRSRRWPMTWKLWSFLVKMVGEVDQIKGDENCRSKKWWWKKCSKPKNCIGTRKPKRSSGHEDGQGPITKMASRPMTWKSVGNASKCVKLDFKITKRGCTLEAIVLLMARVAWYSGRRLGRPWYGHTGASRAARARKSVMAL